MKTQTQLDLSLFMLGLIKSAQSWRNTIGQGVRSNYSQLGEIKQGLLVSILPAVPLSSETRMFLS